MDHSDQFLNVNSPIVKTVLSLMISTVVLRVIMAATGFASGKVMLPSSKKERNGPPKYSSTDKALVVSFCICAMGAVSVCGYLGVWGLLFDLEAVSVDRLSGSSDTAILLSQVMVGYQIWNFVMSLLIPEFGGVVPLLHHCVAGYLSYWIALPYVNYYAFFFLGVAEISTIPNCFMDICKYVPEFKAAYPTVDSLSLYSFAFLFLLLRCVIWPIQSVYYWMDSVPVVAAMDFPGALLDINFQFMIGNVILTCMQFYWGKLIIQKGLRHMKRAKQQQD